MHSGSIESSSERHVSDIVTGILEWTGKVEGRLRALENGLVVAQGDPFVPLDLGSKFMLRQAQEIEARVISRKPRRRRGRRNTRPRRIVEEILKIDGLSPEEYGKRKTFEELTNFAEL